MGEVKKAKILMVDDVEMNLIILGEIINSMGHEPMSALSAHEALEILKNDLPKLILLDVSMPDMSGLEFCELLKKDVYTREIPVIFISALDSTDDLSKGFEIGAVDYITKPFEPDDVKLRVDTHLKLFTMQQELEDANRRLNGIIKQQMDKNLEKRKLIFNGVTELANSTDVARTYYCGMEADMVRKLTQALVFSDEFENEISESFLEYIEIAAMVHDIGMMSIPENIKYKPQKLTNDEYEEVKKHIEYGANAIAKMFSGSDDAEFCKVTTNVIRYHHERFDGSGYPEGLSGKNIPLEARIMAVIDVYDALVNERCYRPAMEPEDAIEFLQQNAGKAFDPEIINIFKKIERQFKVKK